MDSNQPTGQSPKAGPLRDTSRRFLYLVIGLVVICAFGFFGARPLYAKFKAGKAVERALQAKSLMAENKYDEANEALKNAMMMAPAEPEVLRQVGLLCKQSGSPAGLASWQALLRTPAATLQDRLDFIEMALRFERVDLIEPQLKLVMRSDGKNPKVLNLLVQYLRAQNQPAEAIFIAREWLSRESTSLDAQFMLGNLLANSADLDEQAEGQRLLLGLAVGKPGQNRDQAVKALAQLKNLPPGESQILLKALAERPGTETARAEIELNLNPLKRDEIVAAMVERAKNATNDVDLWRYANWIGQRGSWQLVPDLLPEDKVSGKSELLTLRLQALIESDRINEVVPYLQMSAPPVSPYFFNCLKALAAQRQNKTGQIRTHFDGAIASATNSQQLLYIANFAERLGANDAAIAAFQRLMQVPGLTITAGRDVIRLASKRKDLATTRDTYKRMAAYLPGDDTIFVSAAYLSFLMGDSQPATRSALAQRAKKKPNETLFPLVQALGEFRAGKNADALALLEGLKDYDWDKAEPRWLAVYAAVLGANQQREAARLMASKVDVSALKLQEEELIKPWR